MKGWKVILNAAEQYAQQRNKLPEKRKSGRDHQRTTEQHIYAVLPKNISEKTKALCFKKLPNS